MREKVSYSTVATCKKNNCDDRLWHENFKISPIGVVKIWKEKKKELSLGPVSVITLKKIETPI